MCAQTIPEEKMERTDATFGEVEGKLCIQYFQVKEGKAYLHEQNSQLIFLKKLIHFRSVWGFGRLS